MKNISKWEIDFDERFTCSNGYIGMKNGSGLEISQRVFDEMKSFLSSSIERARLEERKYIIGELEQVTRVHNYLTPEILKKVIRFIENCDKPGEEI